MAMGGLVIKKRAEGKGGGLTLICLTRGRRYQVWGIRRSGKACSLKTMKEGRERETTD